MGPREKSVCVHIRVWTHAYARVLQPPSWGRGFHLRHTCSMCFIKFADATLLGGWCQICQMTKLGSKGKLTGWSDGVDLTR